MEWFLANCELVVNIFLLVFIFMLLAICNHGSGILREVMTGVYLRGVM